MLLVRPKNLLIGEDWLKLFGMASIFLEITKGIVNDKEAERIAENINVYKLLNIRNCQVASKVKPGL